MFAAWKSVRVLMSSTFREMHVERGHLMQFRFLRLRRRLLSHGIHLLDVDLRWDAMKNVGKNNCPRSVCSANADGRTLTTISMIEEAV